MKSDSMGKKRRLHIRIGKDPDRGVEELLSPVGDAGDGLHFLRDQPVKEECIFEGNIRRPIDEIGERLF